MLIQGTCLSKPDVIDDTRGHRTIHFRVRGDEGRVFSVHAARQLAEFCRHFLCRGTRVRVLGDPAPEGVLAREIHSL